MTALARRDTATPAPAAAPASPPEPGPNRREHLDLALQLWRPTGTSVVVHIAGELDAHTAPRLHELLSTRLAETVILDLSELRFLGVVGLELLARAHQRGPRRAMAVCIVDGPVCVDRALRAAGWSGTIPAYDTVVAAVADLTGHRDGSSAHAAR